MELKLSDLTKENSRYLRKDIDGGILTEKYEIDQYKLQEYVDVVDNLMLGNYNEFGDYEIQKEIISELLNCKKVVTDNYENILFVESVSRINVFGRLNFAIKVIDAEQVGFKTAILELLEPIYKAKGFIENTQATVLKRVNLPFNDAFKDEVYKQFNIVLRSGDGAEIELENDEDFNETIDRKIRLLYIKKHLENQNDFMICYNNNIQELEKTVEGKKVLEEFKKEEKIAEKYLKVEPNDYKSKNELLTKNIETFFPVKPKPIVENLTKLNNSLVENIKKVAKIAQKSKNKLIKNIKKDEQDKKRIIVVKNTNNKNVKSNRILDVFEKVL